MTVPANLQTEAAPWGSTPVTPCWGTQGGPYNVTGSGANALPIQGADAIGAAQTARPLLNAGIDGSGNVQALAVNQDLTLLPPATRTATVATAAQTNQNARGILVFVNTTAASGTGGLTINLQVLDPASGAWRTQSTGFTVITTTGTFCFILYPTAAGGLNNGVVNQPLARTWRVQIVHGDSSNYTYSVGASQIL